MKPTIPTLADGHILPTKPVYWLIWVLNSETRQPYHSRLTDRKFLTPNEAAQNCYGSPPSPNMVFFNMTSRITDMRKMLTTVGKLWIEKGGKR